MSTKTGGTSGEDGANNKKEAKQLSIDRAVFLILRVRRVFRKKITGKASSSSAGSQQPASNVHDSRLVGGAAAATGGGGGLPARSAVPLLRSRTLPSIVVPGLSILHAQIESTLSARSKTKPQGTPADVNNSLTVPAAGSSADLPDIRDLFGLSNIPIGVSGRLSDPGSPTSSQGAKDKRSSASPVNAGLTPSKSGARSSFKFINTRNGDNNKSISLSPSRLVRPANSSEKITSHPPIQLQIDSPSPVLHRRRYSLESNNDLLRTTPLASDKYSPPPPPPDVTTSASSARGSLNLTLAVPEHHHHHHHAGKSVPASPSNSGKRNKAANADRKKDSSLELLVHGLNLTKTDLKKMEKLTKINIHLHALFAAVEFGQVEKARAILEDNEVDINSYNSDGLSLLDVAVLTNSIDMVKLLMEHGAREGMEYGSRETLSRHLVQLLSEAERQLEESSTSAAATTSSTSPVRVDWDKHMATWKRRVRILRKMKAGLEQLKLPNSPNQARVEVVGERSAHIWWLQPEIDSGGICTKFKVQWSTHPEFIGGVSGELEVHDSAEWRRAAAAGDEFSEINVTVSDCPANARCFFRLAAGNLAGYGAFKTTLPASVVISAWRSIDGRRPRFAGRLLALDDLFSKVRTWRPDYASEIRQLDDGLPVVDTKQQRKNAAKINLRQFFGANVKFQKNLRRGVYLACIIFHEDKVLVTTEDFPPVVEVDDTYPASVNNDFHWLMKIGCTWNDVKTLRQDMERNSSSASAHFRIKLLQAAAQLQSALGLQDLGQLHYQPLKDSHGTLVISSTCHLANVKAVPSSLNFKWLPLSKLMQRRVVTSDEGTAGDLLLASLQEHIDFLQVSNKPLPRGLYLGYLKMKSSVDLIRVLVPRDAPNLLPHAKIRDNPWVTSEEWSWIKRQAKNQQPAADSSDNNANKVEVDPDIGKASTQPTTAQLLFQSQLQRAANKLLNSMGIEGTVSQHRIYEDEVIELSRDVSVILLLPPPDSVCAVAGQSEALFHRPEFLSVPVQVFEMIHLRTYQRDLIGRYSRLSSILELDSNLAQLAVREAFSTVELAEAKQRIQRLQDVQTQVDATWRGSRWIMDVLSIARDRTINGVGVAIGALAQQSAPPSIQSILPIAAAVSGAAIEPARSILAPPVKRDPVRIQAPNDAGGAVPPAKHRVLLKTKSDNKLLENRPEPSALQRIGTLRSRTPVCKECSVPLDLPGYVSNCGSCSKTRQPSHPATGELFKQHSRSNETLPTPPMGQQNEALKSMSRSENQLNSVVDFLPFLDAEGSDTVYAATRSSDHQEPEDRVVDEPSNPPPTKLQRGGSSNNNSNKKGRTGSSMRSNSQESECSHQSRSSHTPSLTSLSSVDGDPDSNSVRSADADNGDTSASAGGIIQVYAAYESGLANGTSVKLHVTHKTVAREVVDLVVRQLNMAVVLKGKSGPVYPAEEFKNFCLVAVIGARERCLRDDFRPLTLQLPWKKGRLYVRQKKDVLAAIEQSGRLQPTASTAAV